MSEKPAVISFPVGIILDLVDQLPKGGIPYGANVPDLAKQLVEGTGVIDGSLQADLCGAIAYLLWKAQLAEQYVEPVIVENERLKRQLAHLGEMVASWEREKGAAQSAPVKPYKGTWYSWSVDEESYEGFHPTREDAIAEAIAERANSSWYEIGDTMIIHTGVCIAPATHHEVSRALDPEWVLDTVQDNLSDEAGEFADDAFDGVSLAAKDDLGKSLTNTFMWWMTKHDAWPTYFTVEKTETHHHELTAEDVDDVG